MEPFPPRTPLTLSYAGQIARQRHFIKLPSILFLRFAIVNAWKERPVVESGQRRRPRPEPARSLPFRPAPAARSLSGASVEGDSADVPAVVNCHARKTRGCRTSTRSRGSDGAPEAIYSSSNHTTHHRNYDYKHRRDSSWSGDEHNPRILVSDEDEDEDGMGVLPDEGVGIGCGSDGLYGGMVGDEIDEGKGWITVARKRKMNEKKEGWVMGDGGLGSGG